MRRTGRMRAARVHLFWICQLLALSVFMPVMFVSAATWAVTFVSIAIGFSMVPNSPYYSICAELFPNQTGVATGFIVTLFSLPGIVCLAMSGWLAECDGGLTMAFAALCGVLGSTAIGRLLFSRDESAPRHSAADAN